MSRIRSGHNYKPIITNSKMKQNLYESPDLQIIALCSENAVLTTSEAARNNKNYDLYYDGEDEEFL